MKRLLMVSVSLSIGLAAMGRARAQFESLTQRVPNSANTIVLFDEAKVFESPAAVAGNWKEEYDKACAAGLAVLPPETNQFVLASQLDFEFMQSIWDVALLSLTRDASLPSAAQRLGGRLDNVGGLPGIALPNDTYIVEFAKRTVGSMSPGNRQNVGRWIRETQSQSTGNLSPYLREALGFANQVGTPVVMAMDLQDVVTPGPIRERLNSMRALEHHENVDLDALTQLLVSLRGVTLGITIGEKPFGKIKVDFGQDASIMSGFAKPLLLEILANRGATVDDFDAWTAKVVGNQISIEGFLSESGLRRITSLMDVPLSFAHAHAHAQKQQVDEGQQQQAATAQASKVYFDNVVSLFDDLAGKKGTAKHINQYGVWFERYAEKVDRLPLLNVDSELLDYGQYIATQFRNASAAIKGIGMRGRVRQVNEVANLSTAQPGYSGYSYGGQRYGRYGAYGGYGFYGQYNSLGYALNENLQRQQSVRTQIRAQEKYTGTSSARTIMNQMKEATLATRRKMTEKYQIEF
ncbi:MAG: hypothetical protein ACC628_09685 [Pirellulaceae bacterium]